MASHTILSGFIHVCTPLVHIILYFLKIPITIHQSSSHRPPHLKDLEALEPAFYNSLLWIQENDPEPLDLTFTVEEVGLVIH